jgi:hypothetical protein
MFTDRLKIVHLLSLITMLLSPSGMKINKLVTNE